MGDRRVAWGEAQHNTRRAAYNPGMTDEDALLSAIAAAPDENTPRLAFADWLQEHDRPIRAEFIRVQVEISRVETLPRVLVNRYVDVFKRSQDLIDDHRDELLGPLAALPANSTRIEFRRGFVSQVELGVDQFLEHAGNLYLAMPQPSVRVAGVAARLGDFCASEFLGCVTHIGGYFPDIIETSPALPALEIVHNAVNRLTRLESLDLEGCGVTDDLLGVIGNRYIPTVTDFDLSNNLITDAGVIAFAHSQYARTLRRLILGGNPITDDGAVALAEQWPADSPLQHLNLRFTDIGPRGHHALLTRFGGRVDLF